MTRFTFPPAFVLCAALVALAPVARALETDQYTVPEAPLADVGPDVSRYVMATVWDVVQDVNARAAAHDREARRTAWGMLRDYHRGRAERFRSEGYLDQRIFQALAGSGLPECKIEQWVWKNERRLRSAEGGPVLFRMSCDRAVFGDSPFTKPLLLVDLSPTMNVYGHYIGLDKFGHLLQQGHDYYNEYCGEERRGGTEAAALARAVRVGVGQEEGIFGEALVGVYSNADLAANYAGLKFYLNLTRPVTVAGKLLPPVLVRGANGSWALNPYRDGRAEDLLRPFISDHLNEALNPSRYSDQMRATVQSRLRRRADKLVAFYQETQDDSRAQLVELSKWHGEDYGHCGFGALLSIADNCVRGADRTAPRQLPPAPSRDGEARTAAARLSTGPSARLPER